MTSSHYNTMSIVKKLDNLTAFAKIYICARISSYHKEIHNMNRYNLYFSRMLIFVLLLTGLLSTVRAYASSYVTNCIYFSEDFSGLSGNTWYATSSGIWSVQSGQVNVSQITSGTPAYYYTSFLPNGYFAVDVDVNAVSAPQGGAYGIYPYTSGGTYFSVNGQSLDGVAGYLFSSGNAYLLGWDMASQTWYQSTKYVTTPPVTSIGVAYSSDAITLRINKQDTTLKISGSFTNSYLLIDMIALIAQGSGTSVNFDNICADPVSAQAAQFTLTVTKSGSGSVASSPSGISCGSDCTEKYNQGTSVVLTATPASGSVFSGWSGGGCSGTGSCTLTVSSDTSVTASFTTATSSTTTLPTTQQSFSYSAVENPVKSSTPSAAKPVGVGAVANNGSSLSLKTETGQFAGAVDLYLAFYFPAMDSANVYILNGSNQIQSTSNGIAPWKSGVTSVNESLFGTIPVSSWPFGSYYIGLLAAPAGSSLSNYYFWITDFNLAASDSEPQPAYTGGAKTVFQDSDGDGVIDYMDPYPSDNTKYSLTPTEEKEFNNNITDATPVTGDFPMLIKGSLAKGSTYYLDSDYFKITGNTGDRISIITYRGTVNSTGTEITFEDTPFTPKASILDSTGKKLATAEITGIGIASGIGVEIPGNGSYYIEISDSTITAATYTYPYVVSIFRDADLDGVSDALEQAIGSDKQATDTDGDVISDYNEIFAFTEKIGGIKTISSQANALNWWDIEGDGIPNWYDVDSDGDGIPDRLEGTDDPDNDGIPNFLDTDSNGNGTTDPQEAGNSLQHPADTDGDGIPNFADLDIDNDGIPNTIDSNTYSTQTAINTILISFIEAQADASTKVRDIAIPGKTLYLYGSGITSNMKVIMPVSGGTISLTPDSIDTAGQKITVTTPSNIVDGVMYLSDGTTLSSGFALTTMDSASDPVITALSSSSVKAGDTLTITGLNLSYEQVTVAFENEKASVSATAVAKGTSVAVPVPSGAVSGLLYVAVGSTKTNTLPITVTRSISATVNLKPGITVDYTKMTLMVPSGSYPVNSSYTATVPIENYDLDYISSIVDTGNGEYALVYEAVVLPGNTSITMTAATTAVKMVFSNLGYEVTQAKDKWSQITALIGSTQEVGDLAAYIDQLLAADISGLTKFTDATLITKFQNALVAASNAVAASLAPSPTAPAPPQVMRFAPVQPVITPAAEQYGISLYAINDADLRAYNASKVYASVYAKSVDGTVIHPHIKGYYDSDILGPAGWVGYFTGYFASSGDYDIKGRDTHFEIITGGLASPRPSNTSVHYRAAGRTILDGMLIPPFNDHILKPIISSRVGSDKVADFLLVLFGPSALQSVIDEAINNPSALSAALKTWYWFPFKNIINDCLQVPPGGSCNNLAQLIFEHFGVSKQMIIDRLKSDLGKWLAKKFIPVVGQVDAAFDMAGKVNTWGNVLVTGYSLAAVPGQIDFDANYPLEITEVKPLCLAKTSKGDPTVLITGNGFAPIKNGTVWTEEIYPEVYIDSVQGDVKNIKADGTSILASFDVAALSDGEHTLTVKHQGQTAQAPQMVKVASSGILFTSIEPARGSTGSNVSLYGCGFSEDLSKNAVFFTAQSGTANAAVMGGSGSIKLTVTVPDKAVTGDVYVTAEGKTSNKLNFTVEQSQVTITYGDNGAATDDTFALYADGSLISSMSSPTTAVTVNINLSPGNHEIKLVGITAPDSIGTYYVSFSSNVTVVSGAATSGSDLTAGVVKTWTINVTSSGTN